MCRKRNTNISITYQQRTERSGRSGRNGQIRPGHPNLHWSSSLGDNHLNRGQPLPVEWSTRQPTASCAVESTIRPLLDCESVTPTSDTSTTLRFPTQATTPANAIIAVGGDGVCMLHGRGPLPLSLIGSAGRVGPVPFPLSGTMKASSAPPRHKSYQK